MQHVLSIFPSVMINIARRSPEQDEIWGSAMVCATLIYNNERFFKEVEQSALSLPEADLFQCSGLLLKYARYVAVLEAKQIDWFHSGSST